MIYHQIIKFFFLFTNIIAFKSFLTDSKGEKFIKKSKHIILKKGDNLIYKASRKIIKSLKYFKTKNILHTLEKKINDIDYINKTFFENSKKNFDIVFSQNGITSGWAHRFYQENKSIVINFPATSRLQLKEDIIPIKARPFGHYMFVNTVSEKKNWAKKIDKKKIFVVGMPKFNENLIKKKKTDENKIKKVVLAYTSTFKRFGKKNDTMLEKQFLDIVKVLSEIPNIKVYIKVHPFKNNPHYRIILNKFDKNVFLETNTNLKDLALKSDLLITNLGSSAILDGLLAKIPSIEFWDVLQVNKSPLRTYSFFSRNKLSKLCKNKKELKKYILIGLKKPNDIFWKKKYLNFKKIYQPKKINYNSLIHSLLKYEKLN